MSIGSDKPLSSWNPRDQAPDVAVLVALREEFRELLALVGPGNYESHPNATYGGDDYLFHIESERGRAYRVVAFFMDDMGPSAATHAAQRLLELRPALIANIGIACSLDADDLRLCDVVVANQVDGYDDKGKATDDENGAWNWVLGGEVYRATELVVHLTSQLEFSEPDAFDAWQRACAEELEAVAEQSGDARRAVRFLRDRKRIRKRPELMKAHLASGASVAAAKAFTDFLRSRRDRNIKALEMEAAGVLRAAQGRARPIDTLVLRGISDLGDADKKNVDLIGDGSIRRVAMRNAIRLFWSLMHTGRLPRVEDRGSAGSREGASDEVASAVEGATTSVTLAVQGRRNDTSGTVHSEPKFDEFPESQPLHTHKSQHILRRTLQISALLGIAVALTTRAPLTTMQEATESAIQEEDVLKCDDISNLHLDWIRDPKDRSSTIIVALPRASDPLSRNDSIDMRNEIATAIDEWIDYEVSPVPSVGIAVSDCYVSNHGEAKGIIDSNGALLVIWGRIDRSDQEVAVVLNGTISKDAHFLERQRLGATRLDSTSEFSFPYVYQAMLESPAKIAVAMAHLHEGHPWRAAELLEEQFNIVEVSERGAVSILSNLVLAYYFAERYELALEATQQLYSQIESNSEELRFDALRTMVDIYTELKKCDEARGAMALMRDIDQQRFGMLSSSSLARMADVELCLYNEDSDVERLHNAIRHLEHELELQQRSGNEDVITTYGNLAALNWIADQYPEALEWNRRVLELLPGEVPQSPYRERALIRLLANASGFIIDEHVNREPVSEEDQQVALQLGRQAFHRARSVFGVRHPVTAGALYTLLLNYSELGECTEVGIHLANALSEQEGYPGWDFSEYAFLLKRCPTIAEVQRVRHILHTHAREQFVSGTLDYGWILYYAVNILHGMLGEREQAESLLREIVDRPEPSSSADMDMYHKAKSVLDAIDTARARGWRLGGGVLALGCKSESTCLKVSIEPGDIVREYDGHAVRTADELIELTKKSEREHRNIRLLIERDGRNIYLDVDSGHLGVFVW